MRRPLLSAAIALGPAVGLGLAASVAAASELLRAAPGELGPKALAANAVAMAAGLGLSLTSARWIGASAARRSIRGARSPTAYLAWLAWTAVFLGLSFALRESLGRPEALLWAGFTVRIGTANLDLVPRLFFDERGAWGPGLRRVAFEDLDGYEIVAEAAPGMGCLRLWPKAAAHPLEEWMSPSEAPAVARLLREKKVKERASGLPRPRPPVF